VDERATGPGRATDITGKKNLQDRKWCPVMKAANIKGE
jgi:hypothetical protein